MYHRVCLTNLTLARTINGRAMRLARERIAIRLIASTRGVLVEAFLLSKPDDEPVLPKGSEMAFALTAVRIEEAMKQAGW